MSVINNEKVLDFFHDIGRTNVQLANELYVRWVDYNIPPPKEQPKDYEILERGVGSWLTSYPPQFIEGEITKVKRLSDGEIFVLGDEIGGLGGIKRFEIIDPTVRAYFEYKGKDCTYTLKNLEKQKQPLFRTHDGVDIYEGDEYWFLNGYEICYQSSANTYLNCANTRFSTEQAAKEYIIRNKPCLSAEEIMDWFCKDTQPMGMIQFCSGIKQLAEEKINQ